jgi:hypothetical protein
MTDPITAARMRELADRMTAASNASADIVREMQEAGKDAEGLRTLADRMDASGDLREALAKSIRIWIRPLPAAPRHDDGRVG